MVHYTRGGEDQEDDEQLSVIIQHVFKESNTLTNFLTNYAFDFVGEASFNSFSELPTAGRRILNLDKAQTPNFKIKNLQRREPD